MEGMKRLAKRVIHVLGWDVRRVSPTSNPSAQLLTALNHIGANVVFDVGANVGQFAQDLRFSGFAGRIISFEPQSDAHDKLAEAARSDLDWVIHSRAAVGDQDGEIEVNISGNSVSSSVLPMLDAHSSAAVDSAYVSAERAALVRLDSVAAQYLDKHSRCFIKIDTQGFEWQVLDGATDTLRLSRGVMLELSLLPLYDNQRLWREIVDRMESEGLTLWAIQEGFIDPRSGRTLQVDAIFLREECGAEWA